MREAQRAYNLLRAFVNQEFERIRGVDASAAWRELNEPAPAAPAPTPEAAPEDVERDLEATARTLLNVTAAADFDEVRQAYERISRRVQPEKFDAGSDEAARAQELLRKATWAYQYLTKDVAPIERRFRSLEIE